MDPRAVNSRTSTTIRDATAADARAIAELTVAGWRAAYRQILPDDYLDGLSVDARETGWRAFLEASDGAGTAAWIAMRDGRAVGFASGGPPRDDDAPPDAREVFAIYVDPRAWRTGAGRLLLGRAADWAAQQGARQMLLWVLERNDPARAFYEAMGWRPDGGRQLIELHEASAVEVRYRIDLGG